MKPRDILLLLFIYSQLPAIAQVQKINEPTQIWAGVEAEYLLSQKSRVYFDTQGRHVTKNAGSDLKQTGFLSYVEDIRATLGYERLIFANTFLGVAQRVSVEKEEVKSYSRIWALHEKEFGNYEIENRILFEHIRAKDITAEPEKIDPENRIRGNMGLSRKFSLFKKELEISTEVEALFNLGKTEPNEQVRFIDRTRLEVAISFPVSERFEISIFGISQTRYRYEKPENGTDGPTEQQQIKTNVFTPIVGIELQFTGGSLGQGLASSFPQE